MKVIKKLLQNDLTSVVLPTIVLFLVLLIGSKGFLSAYNMVSLLQNVAIYVLIGLSQMSALALGQFNLALGSMGCMTAIFFGLFCQGLGVPLVPALIIGILVGVLCGVIQGVLIAKTGMSPFIITLALLSVFEGIPAVITQGASYSELPEVIKIINRTQFGPVPLIFIISMVIVIAAFILFHYTDAGRHLLAVGANKKAAKFSGINVDFITILGHALSGLFAAFGSFIQICKFGSAQLAIGSDWMMNSFVVAVLGGTIMSGGKVSVIGTLIGSILLVFINNALGLWKVNTYLFQTIMGLILLGAYEIDRARLLVVKRQSSLDTKEDDK